MLTATGTASKAYADSAAEYMRWGRPDAKVDLLEIGASMLGGRSTDNSLLRNGLYERGSSRLLGKEPLDIEMENLEKMLESDYMSV